MKKIVLHSSTLFCLAAVLMVTSASHAQRVFLLVDRDSGSVDAVSSADIHIDGYTIKSSSGKLDPETWQSLTDQGTEGWIEAQPRIQQLSELNWLSSSQLVGSQAVSLGTPYAGTGVAPADEDVIFEYSTPEGVFGTGQVRYLGAPQVPALLVDRASGAVQLSNPSGFEIAGYSIISDAGSLAPDGLTSGLADQNTEGWFEANLSANRLSELSLENSHVINGGNPLGIGNAFTPGGAEDLEFEYLTVDGQLSDGLVSYSGLASDLTLSVDLLSGEALLTSPAAAGDYELIGYSVTSPSGGLSVENWTSFVDGGDAAWTEANPSANSLSELSASGSRNLTAGSSISLGDIFVGTQQDLVLEYSTPAGVAFGTVAYDLSLGGGVSCTDIAASRIPGDLDGNGEVAFADFLVLAENFGGPGGYEQGDIDCGGDVAFADFLLLAENFGKTAAQPASSVPEPSGVLLSLLAALGMSRFFRRRR